MAAVVGAAIHISIFLVAWDGFLKEGVIRSALLALPWLLLAAGAMFAARVHAVLGVLLAAAGTYLVLGTFLIWLASRYFPFDEGHVSPTFVAGAALVPSFILMAVAAVTGYARSLQGKGNDT